MISASWSSGSSDTPPGINKERSAPLIPPLPAGCGAGLAALLPGPSCRAHGGAAHCYPHVHNDGNADSEIRGHGFVAMGMETGIPP